eukprot:8128234-Heterocapsa_arctica.AAC.1
MRVIRKPPRSSSPAVFSTISSPKSGEDNPSIPRPGGRQDPRDTSEAARSSAPAAPSRSAAPSS